jgi:hypothetical protein
MSGFSLDETKWPYNIATPQRGGDAIIPLMALLRNDGVKCFIAGGFARWILSENETTPTPGDIDFYFQDDTALHKATWVMTREGFTVALETDNAVSYRPPNTVEFDIPIGIQFIKPRGGKRCGTIHDVLDGFDLSICQAALELTSENKLKGYVSVVFGLDEANQDIHVINVVSPLATMQRCMKYARKGYKIGHKELLKIFAEWDKVAIEKRTRIFELIEKVGGNKELYDLLDE